MGDVAAGGIVQACTAAGTYECNGRRLILQADEDGLCDVCLALAGGAKFRKAFAVRVVDIGLGEVMAILSQHVAAISITLPAIGGTGRPGARRGVRGRCGARRGGS